MENASVLSIFNTKLHLPQVTLVCVDTLNVAAGYFAIQNCMEYAQFGAVKYFSLFPGGNTDIGQVECIDIVPLKGKEDYSRFVFFSLDQFIETEFVMICQHDGYVVNPSAWRPEFLQYDYIGAPWWRDEQYNVGNGGFSLRSTRLMSKVAVLGPLMYGDASKFHPEDDMICRKYRKALELEGFKFAPEDLAARFSWESNPKYPHYNGAFGFHGGIDDRLAKHIKSLK